MTKLNSLLQYAPSSPLPLEKKREQDAVKLSINNQIGLSLYNFSIPFPFLEIHIDFSLLFALPADIRSVIYVL